MNKSQGQELWQEQYDHPQTADRLEMERHDTGALQGDAAGFHGLMVEVRGPLAGDGDSEGKELTGLVTTWVFQRERQGHSPGCWAQKLFWEGAPGEYFQEVSHRGLPGGARELPKPSSHREALTDLSQRFSNLKTKSLSPDPVHYL